MSKKSRKALPAVHLTDLSDVVVSDTADDNPLARTRVAGFAPEVERLHRKHAELEKQLARMREENAELRREKANDEYHLKRRTRALWTLCVTLGGKAIYGLTALPTHTTVWWVNVAQGAVGVITVGYLFWPQARVLLKLSRDITVLKRDERNARDARDGRNEPSAK